MQDLPIEENPTQDDARTLVLLADDLTFAGARLSELLEEAGYETVTPTGDVSLASFVSSLEEIPDLMIVQLYGWDPSGLQRVREARAAPRARLVPILAVTTFEQLDFDLQTFRSHGVVGLIDARADPAVVRQRVEQIAGPTGCRRRCERAPCLFPVELKREGIATQEWALNLSASGMRLTYADELEPNTDVRLRFRLLMVAEQVIEADARLVHHSRLRNSWGRFEIGVFLYPLPFQQRRIIEREVARLLAG